MADEWPAQTAGAFYVWTNKVKAWTRTAKGTNYQHRLTWTDCENDAARGVFEAVELMERFKAELAIQKLLE